MTPPITNEMMRAVYRVSMLVRREAALRMRGDEPDPLFDPLLDTIADFNDSYQEPSPGESMSLAPPSVDQAESGS